ncbi:MAG: site-2 protease family protein [Peptococcaceae bacterium]|nr:site-2 protease family protein [Peptococcaceae bacterium]
MSYLTALFLIGLAVLVHELGHFIAARRASVPIRVFSVGFGPGICGFKKGKTEYRLSLIPLGGYVLPDIEDEKDFFAIPVKNRTIMAVGGPLANIILSILCFAVINTAVNGFSMAGVFLKPVALAALMLYQMFAVMPLLFSHPDQLSGVVGIVAQGGQFIGVSLLNGLQFLALISLNVAIINMLPIPALDGGKILLYLMEKIHPRLLRLHLPLSVAGWILVMGLMVYVTVADIVKVL